MQYSNPVFFRNTVDDTVHSNTTVSIWDKSWPRRRDHQQFAWWSPPCEIFRTTVGSSYYTILYYISYHCNTMLLRIACSISILPYYKVGQKSWQCWKNRNFHNTFYNGSLIILLMSPTILRAENMQYYTVWCIITELNCWLQHMRMWLLVPIALFSYTMPLDSASEHSHASSGYVASFVS